MKRSFLAAAWLLVAGAASGQQAAFPQPRLGGHPDFTGEWSNQWLTPLETTPISRTLSASPAQAKTLVGMIRAAAKALGEAGLDPEAVDPDSASLAIVRGEHRTRLVVEPADGLLPYTPAAQKLVQARQALFLRQVIGREADDPEQRISWERCIQAMGQAPLLFTWSIAMNRRLVQTPDALVIWSEAGGETRIVRIGGKPLPGAVRSYLGDSVGRWEGDTLVVETTGFKAEDQFRLSIVGRPVMVAPDSKVVERFTRIAAGELLYQFTVVDPAIYAGPWLAEYSMTASNARTYEFACHEGNYGLPNILKGARAAARLVATKPAKAVAP
jgi:hypothetical protein